MHFFDHTDAQRRERDRRRRLNRAIERADVYYREFEQDLDGVVGAAGAAGAAGGA
eukprot:gene4426-8122_t